jgi:DNA mismatch repair protein MutS
VQRSDELIDLPQTTRRNLELTQTLRGEDSPTLFSLLDTCLTGMGSRRCAWLLAPRRDRGRPASGWRPSPRCTAAAGTGPGRPARQLKGSSDVERITARIALRQVRPRELVALQQSLQKSEQTSPVLHGAGRPFGLIFGPAAAPRRAAPACWRAPCRKSPPRWCATAA